MAHINGVGFGRAEVEAMKLRIFSQETVSKAFGGGSLSWGLIVGVGTKDVEHVRNWLSVRAPLVRTSAKELCASLKHPRLIYATHYRGAKTVMEGRLGAKTNCVDRGRRRAKGASVRA